MLLLAGRHEFLRTTNLYDLSFHQQRNAMAQSLGLFDIVCGEEDGGSLTVQLGEELANLPGT